MKIKISRIPTSLLRDLYNLANQHEVCTRPIDWDNASDAERKSIDQTTDLLFKLRKELDKRDHK